MPSDAIPMSSILPANDYLGPVALARTPTGNIICDLFSGSERSYSGCGVYSYADNAPYGVEPNTGMPNWWAMISTGTIPFLGAKGDAPLAMSSGIPAEVLEYDNVYYYDTIACSSLFTGLTCWDLNTGHGAFFSREKFVAF